MKVPNIMLFAMVIMALCTAQAEAQEGTVLYEETSRLEFELPPEMQHLRAQVAHTRTVSQQLFFNASASLMKEVPSEEDEDHLLTHGDGNLHFVMRMDQPENEMYIQFDEGQIIEKKDFMGRTFLISGSTSPLSWRLTDERGEFLGYLAQKAIAVQDSTHIEAWFTPEVPVPAGPAHYGGLPGLILVLNLNKGQTVYVAQAVSLEPLDEGTLVPPQKGKQVTREEFETIVAEKMKEMQVERGGNGNVTIFRQH